MVFFYGLGRLPLIGPDEPRYAQVAREMAQTGDWITPRLAGIHWFEKPALTYWLAALGYKLFGVSEFAARCGVALLASGGVLLLYWFGRRVHSARFGYLSAATLITCGLWPGFARAVTFDLPLSVSLELALLCFFLWERQPAKLAKKNALWWVCCFALGLAVLAKGLAGLVLPALIVGPYLLLTRRWKIVLQPRSLLVGAMIFLITAALWYAPMLWRHGREFIDEFFVAHHFQRYTSNKYKHPQPFYFFFLVTLAGSLPWSSFLLAGVAQTWRERYKLLAETERLRLFLWLWVLGPLVFFSLSGSKLPGYILPIFPALALLIGEQLAQLGEADRAAKPRWPQLGVPLVLVLAVIGGGLAGRRELGLSGGQLLAMAGPALLLALGHLALSLRGQLEWATRGLPFGLAVLVMIAVHQVFPALGEVESLAALSQQAQRAALPGERLLFYINSHHSVDFYAPELPLRDARSELVTAMSKREVVEQTNARSSLLVLSPKRWSADLTELPDLTVEILGQSETRQHCAPGCDWLLLRARAQNRP